ncbi:hypothetical protein EPUS_03845 [Endocarpon pusillum Z07020]|uniref:Transcription factor domain-containing protein n=1 Tax=Endocarpon pusillum (strain Z07020 / HMAS-L-300199) TaxID=1263415 RepID=U1HTT4_ENDPU|nr:uncharacterized protein EPUS_03845 [Endocarpon pusillum Z07020]ERF74030.1 hypothetical protein EPUS_03845 [Endocarpon pusillum Z07020]
MRCQKGNRLCPGYPSNVQFQDETAKLHEQFGRTRQTRCGNQKCDHVTDLGDRKLEHLHGASSLLISKPSLVCDSPKSPNDQARVAGGNQLKGHDEELRLGWTEDTALPRRPQLQSYDGMLVRNIYAPDLQQRQIVSMFNSFMLPANQNIPAFCRRKPHWLEELASIQGKDSLLDTALRAVSLVYLSLSQNTPHLLLESRKLYGRSLRLLSRALCDPCRGWSSEALSAAVLLSLYEVFSPNNNTRTGYDSWTKHAGGAGALMQLRGPKAHRHGLNKSVFIEYRMALVIQAFMDGRPCFLDNPEWRKLGRYIQEEAQKAVTDRHGREILAIREDFFMELVRLPGVVSDARNIAKLTRVPGRNRKSVMNDIVTRAKIHRANMKASMMRLDLALENIRQAVREYTNVPQDPIFPISYAYPNVIIASHYVAYWNALMRINTVLIYFEEDAFARQLYARENIEAAQNVCRSVDYMLTCSFRGPCHVSFALSTGMFCLESAKEKEWVVRKLSNIGEKLGMAKRLAHSHSGDGLFGALRKVTDELKQIKEGAG